MPRINIDDSVYRDHRFAKLIVEAGDYWRAVGLLVGAWGLAQKHFLKHDGVIPSDDWHHSPFEILAKCGLAKEVEGGFYIRGTKEQFSWLKQRSEAGRIGGLHGKKNLDKHCSDRLATVGEKASGRLAGTSGRLAGTSGSKPLPLSLELKEIHNTKTLNLKKIQNTKKPSAQKQASANLKTSKFIGYFCNAYKKKYNAQYKISGKNAGIAKRLCADMGEEELTLVVDSYLQMSDSWFISKTHDLATLESSLQKVLVFAQTGKMVTKREAVSVEQVAHANEELSDGAMKRAVIAREFEKEIKAKKETEDAQKLISRQ